jgi:hypothetical protein
MEESGGDGRGRRRSLAVGLLVALALLAGCGATGGVDRTTYSVPERAPLAGADLPSGVSATGLEAPLTMATAHEDALVGRSYEVRRNRTLVVANGTVVSARRVEVRVWRERDQFTAATTRVDGDERVRVEYYASGERVIRARAEGGGEPTAFSTVDADRNETVTADDVLAGEPPYRSVLYRYLEPVREASVERAFDGGVGEAAATYRVTTRSFDDAASLHPRVEGSLRNATLSVTVTDRGVVAALSFRATVEHDGRTLELTDTLRVSNVDETLVWAPEWIERARRTLDDATA